MVLIRSVMDSCLSGMSEEYSDGIVRTLEHATIMKAGVSDVG